jgi:hypothetical protein
MTTTTIFIFCATVGGIIMVCQLVLSLVGLAGDSLEVDVSGDVGHDFGGDFHGDTGGDFHGGDLHADTGAEMTAHDVAGTDAHVEQAAAGHGSSSLFAVISFRTVVAAMAFFGLAGLAADAGLATEDGKAPMVPVLAIAVAAGLGAMYGVYWMMQLLYRLKSEGTVRVEHAVGLRGTVYLRVPAERSGIGKIQLNLQNRTMEYAAVTAGPEIPTGATVVVVNLVAPDTLEVRGVPEPERN